MGEFQNLGPDTVLNLVEQASGLSCSNLFRPLNSYINRVFELETFEGQGVVAKFYRPGRWTKEAITEEHQFLLDLAKAENPVIAPLSLIDGETVAESGELLFSVFPKCGGRSVDEFSDEQWVQLGYLLGRVHQVGANRQAVHRLTMTPAHSTSKQMEFLLNSGCVPDDLKPSFKKVVAGLIADIEPLFKDCELIRIHGDCHFSNIIHRPGESFYIIDFDDMVIGPPVQDVWMLLPGEPEETMLELDLFLEGYETFRPFDRRSMRLIEPLRAMRFIHYMAWCAYQVTEDGLTKAIDGFGTREYWQKELDDLVDQQQRIAEFQKSLGNLYY